MPTSITGTLNAAVAMPLQLLRALADLPRMLEQHARLTDELLRASQEQLALMREQAEALLVQMREIGEVELVKLPGVTENVRFRMPAELADAAQ